jgi:DNA-binding Lrp family transcriptional regulator
MNRLTTLEKEIINKLQKDFPLSKEPFKEIAEELNIHEDECLNIIASMKARGIIRRIGGVFDSKKMGYYSTLCACTVPESDIEKTAALINAQEGVTHNYLRDHSYNLWFTLTAPSFEKATEILEKLQNDTGTIIVSMPATEVYKIKVTFEMGKQDGI